MLKSRRGQGFYLKRVDEMKLNTLKKWIVIGGVALSVVGCASNGSKSSKAMQTAGLGERAKFYGENISAEEEKRLLAENTLLFGFDQYDISDKNRKVLFAHARKLLNNPDARLRVEGHADRRGSRSYNLALGERRAEAARQVLRLKGVPERQISVVSYGKEKPAALGDSEDSFSKNRRDFLAYED